MTTVDEYRAWAQRAFDLEVDAVRSAPEGTRNGRLNTAAFNLGQIIGADQRLLNEYEVAHALKDAALDAGLELRETEGTILSGLLDGKGKPRDLTRVNGSNGNGYHGTDPLYGGNGHSQTRSVPQDAAQPGAYDRALAAEIARQKIQREARRTLDAEEAGKQFVPPPAVSLRDFLAEPDEDVTYTVDKIMPTGANVLLAAQYKTGKTTLLNHLAKCLADGVPFLGRFDVELDGCIGLLNYEVNEGQYRRWLRALNIENYDRIAVMNLRGHRLPLISGTAQDWIAQWAEQANITMLIADPFARAITGSVANENDNSEVGAFLDILDIVKHRAGITDLVMATHTGRAEQEVGAERARGATRLDDWCDVRWLLTKDRETEKRYFRASGRDVELDEVELRHDFLTRDLSIVGGNRRDGRKNALENAVLSVIEANPGISITRLRAAVRQIVKASSDGIDDTVTTLEHVGRVRVERGSAGSPNRHFILERPLYIVGGMSDD